MMIIASFAFVVVLLLWALFPLAQHAVDRTIGFWVVWSAVGLAIIGSMVIYSRRPSGGFIAFAQKPTFTTVRSARTQAEVGLLISILQESGLHPLALSTSGHYSLAGTNIDYAVQVPSDEAAKAREVLSEYDTNAT